MQGDRRARCPTERGTSILPVMSERIPGLARARAGAAATAAGSGRSPDSSWSRDAWIPLVSREVTESFPEPIWDDVDRTLECLRREKITGLVAESLQAKVLHAPPDFSGAIAREYSVRRRTAAVQALEMVRIGRRMPEGWPSPILLKGAAVAKHYQFPQARLSVDIDLMVPRHDVRKWGTFMRELGYRRLGRWDEEENARFLHHTAYVRDPQTGPLVEVHTAMFLERRARKFGYEAILPYAKPGASGLLEPSVECLMVLLALHLYHHPPTTRSLVWFRDFIEIGSPTVIAEARSIAERHDLEWALEACLFDVQSLTGTSRWQPCPVPRQGFGLARVMRMDEAKLLMPLATMRELGPKEAFPFLWATVKAGLAGGHPVAWARRQLGKVFETPWGRVSRSRPRSRWRRPERRAHGDG